MNNPDFLSAPNTHLENSEMISPRPSDVREARMALFAAEQGIQQRQDFEVPPAEVKAQRETDAANHALALSLYARAALFARITNKSNPR